MDNQPPANTPVTNNSKLNSSPIPSSQPIASSNAQSQDASKKQFTSQDLNSIFTPLTPKNALNPLAGTFNPTKLTPGQVEAVAQEWHSSKIVKFGGIFLYLFWAAVIFGMFKVAGFVCLILVTVGIFSSYRVYKKTKSHIAWIILIAFLCVAVAFVTIMARPPK